MSRSSMTRHAMLITATTTTTGARCRRRIYRPAAVLFGCNDALVVANVVIAMLLQLQNSIEYAGCFLMF